MTKLNCNVNECGHNKDNLCILDSINVDGMKSCSSEGTCCENFVPKSEGAFENSVATPSECSDIACSAENCVHNCDRECKASAVNVAVNSESANSDTCCSTFESK